MNGPGVENGDKIQTVTSSKNVNQALIKVIKSS
jgi:hypothetical protein